MSAQLVDGWRVVVRHEPVPGPAHPDRHASLTPLERRRRDRLVRPADREAYAAAHGLVRECAAELLGLAPGAVVLAQTCPTCGGTGHGAPRLVGHAEVAVSLSHTDGYVAAIAATRLGQATGRSTGRRPGRGDSAGRAPRVGIDVERVRDVPADAFSARERRWVAAASDAPAAGTTLWVRKEALVKSGLLDLDGLADCDVLGDDGPAPAVRGHAVHGWSADGVVGAWAVPLT
jgi:4'-phosphopantetheinyl transferase